MRLAPRRPTDRTGRGLSREARAISTVRLHLGDCLSILPTLETGSVDAVVTDPPYGLKFMGKGWDHGVPGVPYWLEAIRVLRPGGYLLSFGGTRTHHRLTCSIEDAGFEIRDCLMWLYGSGFPKGKGCLKPAWEPIVLARKPGKKVLPLGIEDCKVGTTRNVPGGKTSNARGVYGDYVAGRDEDVAHDTQVGRWPPNLLLTHHPDCNGECHADCVVRTLGKQSGESKGGGGATAYPNQWARETHSSQGYRPDGDAYPGEGTRKERRPELADTGTAARFFPQFRYCPKASRRDRNEGCEGMEAATTTEQDKWSVKDRRSGTQKNPTEWAREPMANAHATVKPTDLMEWLVRLACPVGGTVLDPFMGSGSTGKACKRAGRHFIGIERDPQWLPIAERRIEAERTRHPLFAGIAGGD